MALLRLKNQPSAIHSAVIFGGILTLGLGLSLLQGKPAQACEPAPVADAIAYPSPLDLSDLTPQQQQALEATVAKRRELLPYQFLSLKRCPSLSNEAVTAFEQQDYAQALTLLDRAIAEEPNSLYPWLDRAMAHYYLGDDPAARADAEEVRNRLSAPRLPKAKEAYRQLMIQLDGEVSDPRRAVKISSENLKELTKHHTNYASQE